MSQKLKDKIVNGVIYACSGFTVAILVIIIGFILIKGLPGISIDFLTNDYSDETAYVTSSVNADAAETDDSSWIPQLGANLALEDDELKFTNIDSDSPLQEATDMAGEAYAVKKGFVLSKVNDYSVKPEGMTEAEVLAEVKEALAEDSTVTLKVTKVGGGIRPMLITTLYLIGLCLLIAGPIGILAAIYLNEYAKKGRLLSLIHFAIENLSGIPSIIYGLFGSVFFVRFLNMQYSILAGALTVSIILLPTIISTTEETLKTIPDTYRHSSLALGATQLQTIFKVILPNCISGIVVAVLLSIGRIVGESAALLLTAGTVAAIPGALTGSSASGASLTIRAYIAMKEENDLTTACAIGIVLLALIIVLNFASKWVASRATRKYKVD